MFRAAQLVLFSIGCTATLWILPAWVLYVLGNGWVPGTFALGGLALGWVALTIATISPRRVWVVGLAALLVAEGAFAVVRAATLQTTGYCRNGVFGTPPPLVSVLVREPESARAGVALSEFAGLFFPREAERFAGLVDERYGRVDPNGVNALVLASTPATVHALADVPRGHGPAPAILFLHGFGGLMTPYVATLREQPRLDRYAIVAPALGFRAEWWSENGRAVVRRALDTLPAGVNRDEVWLVGLSNGAVGAMAVAADSDLAGRFRGIVALNGGGLWDRVGEVVVPVRLITAEEDPRFPLGYVSAVAEQLGPLGTLVVTPGDHFALFSHPGPVTAAVADAVGAP